MAKQFAFRDRTPAVMSSGVDQLADAVKVTLGPEGRNVVAQKGTQTPLVTNDGVTIARRIILPDPFEDMCAQLVRAAADKTNEVAGDGTTTATVLTQAIIRAGLKNMAAGANPVMLKKGIEAAVDAVVEELRKNAIPVKGKEAIRQIATVSANDEGIGELIADAMAQLGDYGLIAVEEGRGIETTVQVKTGMQLSKGYISAQMVTNPEKMEAVLAKPYILLTDKNISSVHALLPILSQLAQSKRPVLIMAGNVDGEALATLAINNRKKTFVSVAMKVPDLGEERKETLLDIAAVTGASIISDDSGLALEDLSMEMLGTAEKVVIRKDDGVIFADAAQAAAIEQRIKRLQAQKKAANTSYRQNKLDERIGRLSGKAAIIRVGAATETELKEKKYRLEDAIAATKAAVAEGVLPGGGTAYVDALQAIQRVQAEGDAAVGARIVGAALEEPLWQIASNAGHEGAVVVEKVRALPKGAGWNARTNTYEDMLAAGIIDPAKVCIAALQNAASIAALLLTTEVMVCDIIGKPTDWNLAPGEMLR